MGHRISISFDRRDFRNLPVSFHLRRCIQTALKVQHVKTDCEINVLVTDNSAIREINRVQRNIDRATDVLSFPMFELQAGVLPEDWSPYRDPATGFVPLGDMVLSLEQAKKQAQEYGHSVRREIGYLAVHSVLHLLGYDHVDEGPMKKQMRIQEETILAEIMLSR